MALGGALINNPQLVVLNDVSLPLDINVPASHDTRTHLNLVTLQFNYNLGRYVNQEMASLMDL